MVRNKSSEYELRQILPHGIARSRIVTTVPCLTATLWCVSNIHVGVATLETVITTARWLPCGTIDGFGSPTFRKENNSYKCPYIFGQQKSWTSGRVFVLLAHYLCYIGWGR